MTEGNVVVALRRKVRNLETNLLEWRRCTCTFTRDAQLVLELSDDDVDDVELADEDEQGRLRGKCRVVIDLATQLRRIEQKRKSKTRCEIEYQQQLPGAGGRSHSRLLVRTEELMASSAKHCQQFIDRVRAAERQGKRTQSIRLGSMLAANAAAVTAAATTDTAEAAALGSLSSVSQSSSGAGVGVTAGRRAGGSQISPSKVRIDDRLRAHTALSSECSSVARSGAVASVPRSEKSEEISPPSVCVVDEPFALTSSRSDSVRATERLNAADESSPAARPEAAASLAESMAASTSSHREHVRDPPGAGAKHREQRCSVTAREYEVRRCCCLNPPW